MCLLDNERRAAAGSMRQSGDIVHIRDGKTLYYVGRKDSQVKINGRRVDLEGLERVSHRQR